MRTVFLVLALFATAADLGAQRRGAGGGSATLAIAVTDPAGAPIPNVLVTLEGQATRSVRTEGGRIALENLPSGNYRLRFEHEGFLTLERELAARGGAPIDVKVTLKPVPPPPAPPPAPAAPPRPPPPAVDAKLVVFDMPTLIEKEFVGRANGRTTSLACGTASASSMIQVKQPIAEHAHNADEVIYVIAGEGSAQASGRDQKLQAGVFLFVPRGMPHGFKQSGRNPLIVLSTRAGEACGGSQ